MNNKKPVVQIGYKVVSLSTIPNRLNGAPNEPRTSRYNDAIKAAMHYTKRGILLNTPDITTPKQAMIARYGVISAIRSRKLNKTLEVVQRGAQLFLRRATTKTPTPTKA